MLYYEIEVKLHNYTAPRIMDCATIFPCSCVKILRITVHIYLSQAWLERQNVCKLENHTKLFY